MRLQIVKGAGYLGRVESETVRASRLLLLSRGLQDGRVPFHLVAILTSDEHVAPDHLCVPVDFVLSALPLLLLRVRVKRQHGCISV